MIFSYKLIFLASN